MFRILIVDDDAPTRHVIRRFLAPEGYEIDEAADAVDAMHLIATRPPSVALVDVHMPGANGLWLSDQIRRYAPTTAVVLVTGDAEVPPVESLRKGITSYLLKPLSRSELVLAVNDAVCWSAFEERNMMVNAQLRVAPRPQLQLAR